MRFWADPLNQARLCDLLRTAMPLKEAANLLEGSYGQLRIELRNDPEFYDRTQIAQASAFTPVLRRAQQLAAFGDPDDDLTKVAMQEVFKHYNKHLDREHDHAKIEHQAQAQAQIQSNPVPALAGPQQLRELLELMESNEGEIEDADIIEDGDDS